MTATTPSDQPFTPAEVLDLDAIEANARAFPPGTLLTAKRCIPDGQIQHGCVISSGEHVKDALRAAFQAVHKDVPALVAEVRRLRDERVQTRQQLRDEAHRLMLRPAHPPVVADTVWWLRRLAECPWCAGPSRVTVGLVCQACGKDWGSGA